MPASITKPACQRTMTLRRGPMSCILRRIANTGAAVPDEGCGKLGSRPPELTCSQRMRARGA